MPVVFKKLDVRPLIARGVEPFVIIREQVDALKWRGAHGDRTVSPSPLIESFGSEGFRSRIERNVGGGWTVHFWRED